MGALTFTADRPCASVGSTVTLGALRGLAERLAIIRGSNILVKSSTHGTQPPAAAAPPVARSVRRVLAFGAGALLVLVVCAALYQWWSRTHVLPPIRLGLLHSQTGAMAFAESAMIDGEVMAIEEVNAAGGLLGRRVEAVVADGRSDWPTFAAEAERLITQEHVVTVVGCWTSASRKTVKPVFERHSHLLIYPMAYEGLEQSPNIIYIGAAPNQQILPALKWGLDHRGPRIFLVGSDYVWPHAINAIMKDHLHPLGGQLVGEEYIFFGSANVAAAVAAIKAARPDVIFSSIAGDSNGPFYHALRAAGVDATVSPVVSFSIGDSEVQSFPIADLAGQFVAYNYFESIDTPANKAFLQRFRARYGADRQASDPTEAGYFAVHLWAHAVRAAGTTDTLTIRDAMLSQSFEAPEGIVSVDRQTQHTWRPVSIGQITPSGKIDLVWSAARPIRPVPYPDSRTPAQWEAFLTELYQRWGNTWSNPAEQ
ncbi:MAG: ABC transporter substrate-binding protein [Gammaproteobacteria bacterium]|nr:ABC transporter substrate-binding protein [Gammaproteobacteria bacterium]